MEATNRLRWVRRKKKVPPEFNVYNGIPTEVVLQQWWRNTLARRDGSPMSEGEWRDVPIEDETTSPPHP